MIAKTIYDAVIDSVPLARLGPVEKRIVKSFVPAGDYSKFWLCSLNDEWTFMLLVASALSYPFPDEVKIDEGDAFNLEDPELHDLVNLAVDLNSGFGNHDTGMLFMARLKSVEARLKVTAKVATP
jgi:hypothetical protein